VLHDEDWWRAEEDCLEELNFVLGDAIKWEGEGKDLSFWFISMVENPMLLSGKSVQDSTSIISIDDAEGAVMGILSSIPPDNFFSYVRRTCQQIHRCL
jgi:hypothetical protein